ncbi:MAG: HAD family hydrolase [Verrucomicrobia bacterium]|nr:HAD family hydrolase [Verrucomicrobiota bacterium]
MSDSDKPLIKLQPTKEFFIGIDSDGCVFDSMEIKHKECFTPMFIKHFGLQPVSKYARQTWEFVNLYSKTRGTNRFPALSLSLNMLRERSETVARNVPVPDTAELDAWIARETKLTNSTLKAEVEKGNPALARVLDWSNDVNKAVQEMVSGLPPFPFVRESLDKISDGADAIVVSQTPTEALEREWIEHDMDKYVAAIAGQELGSKSDHLQMAVKDKYAPEKSLMIGDAPGDFKAAKDNVILFYPIIPGDEEASWQRFFEEALDKFFAGEYAGAYELELIREFNASLPTQPPWKK